LGVQELGLDKDEHLGNVIQALQGISDGLGL